MSFTAEKKINKNIPIPLYFQLQQHIKEQISSGELKPNDHLPTEQWYCENYGVSRITVRKTLSGLIDEGVLERSRGKGPIVAKPLINRQTNRLTGLHEELTSSGITPTSKLLDVVFKKPSAFISQTLNADPDETIIEIHRIRYANNIPISLQTCSLREKFCPGINVKALENGSLYKILEKEFYLNIGYAKQTISTRLSTRKEIDLLGLERKKALLHLRRISFLISGEAFECSDNFYTEQYNTSMILHR